MFRVFRVLFVLLLIVVGIGFYRGWFSFSRTDDKANNKASVNFSVNRDKMKADSQKVKEEISGEVNELKGKAKSQEAK
jgi:predicted negative regulator of RcsB-dependent stress response